MLVRARGLVASRPKTVGGSGACAFPSHLCGEGPLGGRRCWPDYTPDSCRVYSLIMATHLIGWVTWLVIQLIGQVTSFVIHLIGQLETCQHGSLHTKESSSILVLPFAWITSNFRTPLDSRWAMLAGALAFDSGLWLTQSCQITDGSREPMLVNAFRFNFKLGLI